MLGVEVFLEEGEIYRPALVGVLRERLPELPSEVAPAMRPDWFCEILSSGTYRSDVVRKMPRSRTPVTDS